MLNCITQQLGEGTVLNDFLELLLFGTPSDTLKIFLLKDLTERGMKKLGTSLQAYYKTMQELLTVNMQGLVLVFSYIIMFYLAVICYNI